MRRILLNIALVASAVRAAVTEAASHTTSPTSTSVFFATPPASLSVPADFTAQPFFQTDFLKAFFPGFGPSQTSVEPQPLVTDPVVREPFKRVEIVLNLNPRERPYSLWTSPTLKPSPQPTSTTPSSSLPPYSIPPSHPYLLPPKTFPHQPHSHSAHRPFNKSARSSAQRPSTAPVTNAPPVSSWQRTSHWPHLGRHRPC